MTIRFIVTLMFALIVTLMVALIVTLIVASIVPLIVALPVFIEVTRFFWVLKSFAKLAILPVIGWTNAMNPPNNRQPLVRAEGWQSICPAAVSRPGGCQTLSVD